MDDVYAQVERLAQIMESDPHMIDPVEFGEIKGAVAAMQVQMADLKARHAVTDAKLDLVLDKLSEAKGGWRVMMLLGGAAGSLGAGVSWFAAHLKG
jgi:hypothetical protein